MVKYICAHCGGSAIIPDDTWLDSGATLACNYCKGENVFDIDRPDVRAERYAKAHGFYTLEIEQPNLDEMCLHQAPNKPPGVVGFMHPKSEPCELRDACEAAEKDKK